MNFIIQKMFTVWNQWLKYTYSFKYPDIELINKKGCNIFKDLMFCNVALNYKK